MMDRLGKERSGIIISDELEDKFRIWMIGNS